MKRITAVILACLLITGCKNRDRGVDQAMQLRNELLSAQGCCLKAVVTADYGDSVYTFSMECSFDSKGDMSFEVSDPATIQGITGTVSQSGGYLTFDENALLFEMLADGQVTPVCAPWLVIRALRGGYIRGCTDGDGSISIIFDDVFASEPFQVFLDTDNNGVPYFSQITWQGRRILSVDVRGFSFL